MLVLTRAEKYNIIQGEFDRVRQILQGSSSRKFYARIRSFTDAMAGLVDTWKQEPDSDGDDESATISSADANIDTIESDEDSIWTDGDEVNEMLDKFLSDDDDATNVDDYVGATDSDGDVEVIDLDGDVEVSNGDGDGVGEVEVEVSFTHSKQVDTKNADDSLMDWLVDNPSQVDFPDVIMTTASQIATGITLLTPAAATQSDLRMRKDAIKSSEKKAVHNSPRGISMVHSGAGLIETVAQLTVTRPKGKTLTPEVLEKLRAGGAAYRAEFALRKRKKNQQMQHHAEREQRITQMTDGRSDHLDDQVGGQVGNRVDFPPLYPATLGMTREDPNLPRIAVQRRKKEFPVSIADMLYWVRYFDGVAFVSQCIERYPVTTFTLRHPTISLVTLLPSMHMHNYTLTETALLKFVGAIEARRIEDTGSSKRAPIIWNHDELTEMYVARVRNESASFTELYLDMVSELSDYRLLTKEWRDDWQWLVATDWRKSALAEQMMSIDLGPVKEMAKIAGKKFSQSYLHRPFCAPIPGTESFHEISFKSIIGHVAREKWLQSAQLMHAIYLSLRGRTDVFVIDSLAVKLQTYSPPKRRDIKTIRYIIQPHNIDNQHWTVMIVHLDFSSGIQAFVYDPLIIDENIEILTATWHSFTLPFIKQWYNRDHGTEASILDSSKEEHAQATPRKLFPVLRCQIIEQPVQDDFHSCGIFCIGMVDSVVNKTSDFRKRHSISATDLKALRLKVLCATLSESVGRIEEEENITMRKVKVARITAELQKLKA
ncbi:hypothetical protein Poli38472_003565 [Pythium oligandrum]|uniref:Ubiquitin-like protease family profile domain-containing protein n=1 Tax=Pythium oligandrum TaxID=41045 RepID=A0A8K1CM39_PYTOL|nr:hypothetical protein Poli38472_003565 [Pythium oligandrum]|eukprot:TMW65800.1 hypothetical protein Poli38472_003565 [Pythium oligandrum]